MPNKKEVQVTEDKSVSYAWQLWPFQLFFWSEQRRRWWDGAMVYFTCVVSGVGSDSPRAGGGFEWVGSYDGKAIFFFHFLKWLSLNLIQPNWGGDAFWN